jgi:hypothetical protein
MTVIFDTRSSLAITPELSDFVSPPKPLARPMKLGGMANGIEIKGIGIIAWTFTAKDGTEVQIRTEAYHVLEAKQRLLSPHRLLNKKKGIFGSYSGDEYKFELKLNYNPIISVQYDSRSALPIAEFIVGPEPEPTVNLTILDPGNQNLTGGQKLLLEWHYQFGHLNFQSLQNVLRGAPFVAKRFAAAMKCDLPRCEICELAKAKRRPKISETKTKNPERYGALKVNHLSPVTRVSVDIFECRQRGRTCDSYGKETSQQYKGGCLFVDHGSSYVHVEHQFGFSAVETIRAKKSYEIICFDNGILVQDYLTDSGAFKANKFVKHIHETHQLMRFCETNAHHQDGVAERAIQTIGNMARSMI